MLHHRTDDPALRAEHIADREGKKVWRASATYGDYETWSATYLGTYEAVLRELQPEAET